MNLDLLVIGAHPDDIELTCGGTIAKLTRQGKKVGFIDLTEGEMGTRGSAKIRAKEANEAAKILGVALRENLRIPDGHIENSPENRGKLIRKIREYRPKILLFPYSFDRHPDHEQAHLLCRHAWFYSGLEKLETHHDGSKQEPFRPHAWLSFMQWYEFEPSFIVDVSESYETRMKAVRAYKSQFFDPQSQERDTILSRPEFLEMIETRLEYYGDRIGRKYGEPFYSPNSIGIQDFSAVII
jgi:bacillithiol biosynthesis deacetylase BshB1